MSALHLHDLPRATHGDAGRREQLLLAANEHLLSVLKRSGPFDFVYERYSLWSHAGMDYAQAESIPGLLEVNAPLIEEQSRHRVLVDRAAAELVAFSAFTGASALLAVSSEVAKYLTQFAPASRVHVVPNAIDPGRFGGELIPSRPAPPGIFTVGFVGSLKPWHGLDILVEAFALLCAKVRGNRLLIVGEGPEGSRLEGLVRERGVGEFTELAGRVDPQNIPGLLASMDVGVAPYPASDPFYFSPLKVYEYMAAGITPVVSRLGQLDALIDHGANGMLCTAGDSSSLAATLIHLRKQPELRRTLGQAARDKVLRHHTWDRVADRILTIAGDSTCPASLRIPNCHETAAHAG
jgi:glycosyltransferase involved in cell wall biosynthesis